MTTKRTCVAGILVAGTAVLAGQAIADGDAAKGEKLFNGFLRCNACHSLEPGVTKVGPSLAGLFGRRAGSEEAFEKYSPAMVTSGVTWNEDTLEKFLANPQKFIPGNTMTEGVSRVVGRITSDQHRADVIAYLKVATAPE